MPEELQQLLELQGIDTGSVPEKALLDGAALWLRQRQAALTSGTSSPALSALPDLSTERLCNAASEKALGQIMNGTFLPALTEFLELAAAQNCHVPPAHLPTLLELALRDAELDALLQTTGGPRAAWLRTLNPRWSGSGRKTGKVKPVARQSDADFNATGLEYLALQRDFENGQVITKLLSTPGYHWSNELTMGLVANFLRWLERHGVVHAWTLQHYRAMLTAAAYGCDALTCKAFEPDWATPAMDADYFRRIVAFRKAMIEAFSS